MNAPGANVANAIRAARADGRVALVPYVTAGFPQRDALPALVRAIAPHAATIEIGFPFSDPMADGVTIQRSSRIALERGITLDLVLEQLSGLRNEAGIPPRVLMSYLNPLLPRGLEALARDCASAGISSLIIPDLPLDEAGPVRGALHAHGVGLINMVTPVTEPERLTQLASTSDGFVYAVTMTGVTGSSTGSTDPSAYLARVREASRVPVAAGFGIRSREQVRALAPHADAMIVGSALIEVIERGESPAAFLASLTA
jgi:tryptophan synthase alpha chain